MPVAIRFSLRTIFPLVRWYGDADCRVGLHPPGNDVVIFTRVQFHIGFLRICGAFCADGQ